MAAMTLPLIFWAFSMNSDRRLSTTSSTPPNSPALTMLIKSRLKTLGCWARPSESGERGRGMVIVSLCSALELGTAARGSDRKARRLVRTRAAGDGAAHPADDRVECGRATWRSGGVVDQARRGSERLRHPSSRPRRHARPHRCAALFRSGIMVLYGLACDAVASPPPPHKRRSEARKIRSLCRLCSDIFIDHEKHCHPGIDGFDWPQHAQCC